MNEQATLEPRERQVERAALTAASMMDTDLGKDIKRSYRAPHIMDSSEVEKFLEMLSEMIYQSVGKSRTALWKLDQIYGLYPPSRMHFDYKEMVENKAFDDLVDELANQKALSLALRLVS